MGDGGMVGMEGNDVRVGGEGVEDGKGGGMKITGVGDVGWL